MDNKNTTNIPLWVPVITAVAPIIAGTIHLVINAISDDRRDEKVIEERLARGGNGAPRGSARNARSCSGRRTISGSSSRTTSSTSAFRAPCFVPSAAPSNSTRGRFS